MKHTERIARELMRELMSFKIGHLTGEADVMEVVERHLERAYENGFQDAKTWKRDVECWGK